MNAIQHAMKEAGMRLPPLNKRIWLWLKDHPAKTYTEVAAALGEPPLSVSGQLSVLQKRGMVTVRKDISLKVCANGKNPPISRYSTVGASYELQPMPAKLKPPKAAPPAKAADPVVTLVPRKPGRPKGIEVKPDSGYTTVGIPPDTIALIDQCAEKMEADHCIQLSRNQTIAMVFRQYMRGQA